MNGHQLTSIDCHKELGWSYMHLTFHQHTSEVALKANHVLACIKGDFPKYLAIPEETH